MLDTGYSKTSMIEIRDFLNAQSCAPVPWCPPRSAVDTLYDLLIERRDADDFWAELKDLTRRLDDCRFDPSALPGSDVLGDAGVEQLLDALRSSLPDTNVQSRFHTLREWLGSTFSVAALGGFLLLGTATGCDDVADDTQCTEQASESGMKGDDVEVYCDLWHLLHDADISKSDRNDLLDCMIGMSAGYRGHMLEEFQSLDPDALANYLEELLDPCETCGDDDSGCH